MMKKECQYENCNIASINKVKSFHLQIIVLLFYKNHCSKKTLFYKNHNKVKTAD